MRTIDQNADREAILRTVYEEYYAQPIAKQHSPRLRWVMSSDTLNVLSQLVGSDGQPIYLPPMRADDPELLIGVPVELDDAAEGIHLAEVG